VRSASLLPSPAPGRSWMLLGVRVGAAEVLVLLVTSLLRLVRAMSIPAPTPAAAVAAALLLPQPRPLLLLLAPPAAPREGPWGGSARALFALRVVTLLSVLLLPSRPVDRSWRLVAARPAVAAAFETAASPLRRPAWDCCSDHMSFSDAALSDRDSSATPHPCL
jgi:hypothetical protein